MISKIFTSLLLCEQGQHDESFRIKPYHALAKGMCPVKKG